MKWHEVHSPQLYSVLLFFQGVPGFGKYLLPQLHPVDRNLVDNRDFLAQVPELHRPDTFFVRPSSKWRTVDPRLILWANSNRCLRDHSDKTNCLVVGHLVVWLRPLVRLQLPLVYFVGLWLSLCESWVSATLWCCLGYVDRQRQYRYSMKESYWLCRLLVHMQATVVLCIYLPELARAKGREKKCESFAPFSY